MKAALLVLVIAAWLAIVLTILYGCADMPRGRNGERVSINHGWLEVAQVSDRCMYEQRTEQLRVRCSI